MDSWRSPQGILPTHALYQITKFFIDLGASEAQTGGPPAPITLNPLPVPAGDRFRPHDFHAFKNRRKGPRYTDQEGAIKVR